MRTQILRLETHDTVTSICDKLAWAKAPRILLAFPRRRPPILDRLDLTLILRGASRGGGQLAISTVDAKITEIAKIVGIPVFSSIPAAQRISWSSRNVRRYRPFQPKDSHNLSALIAEKDQQSPALLPQWLRISAFTLSLTAVLALAAVFLPSATIDLPVSAQKQSMNLTVYPGVGIPGVLPGGQVPAYTVQTVVEGQMEGKATGEVLVPDQSATALVTILNQTDETVLVPAGTVFRTEDVPTQRFFTLAAVEIPAGRGQQREVKVRAETPGTAGNVPAGMIKTIEGVIGLQVTVNNAMPAEGGTDRPGRAASDQDYAQLYDQLLTSLTSTAMSQLSLENSQLMIVPESLEVHQVIQQGRLPAAGQPTDRLKLKLKVAFTALAVSRADLEAAATVGLDAGQPATFTAVPGSLELSQKTAWVIIPGQRLTLDLSATRSATAKMDTSAALSGVRGKAINTAAEVLRDQLQLDDLPVIRLKPAWWPRIPLLPFRIQVSA